jgi:hypothetical protein
VNVRGLLIAGPECKAETRAIFYLVETTYTMSVAIGFILPEISVIQLFLLSSFFYLSFSFLRKLTRQKKKKKRKNLSNSTHLNISL